MTKLLCLFVCFLPGVLLPAECPPQLQWQGFYGGTNTDLMRSLVPTKDGGFLVAGVSRSNPTEKKSTPNHGTNDFYVLKVGPHGQKLWEGSFGGAAEDSLTVAKQTSDHGFILGGYSFSGIEGNKTTPNYGVCDYWIVRLDAAGHKLWEQSYGGNDYDALYDLQETDDGGFLLAGRSDSGANGSKSVAQFSPEIWLIRVDSKGDK